MCAVRTGQGFTLASAYVPQSSTAPSGKRISLGAHTALLRCTDGASGRLKPLIYFTCRQRASSSDDTGLCLPRQCVSTGHCIRRRLLSGIRDTGRYFPLLECCRFAPSCCGLTLVSTTLRREGTGVISSHSDFQIERNRNSSPSPVQTAGSPATSGVTPFSAPTPQPPPLQGRAVRFCSSTLFTSTVCRVGNMCIS